MGARILGIELYCFAELRDSRFREMRDDVGAPKQNMQGRRITSGSLQFSEQLCRFRNFLGFQIGDTKEINRFEIRLLRHRGVQFFDGSWRIPFKKIDAAENIMRAS